MSEKNMVVPIEEENHPTIYLRDEQIARVFGNSLDSAELGEEKEVTVRVKVVQMSKREENERDETGELTGKKKMTRTMEVEIVSGKNDEKTGKAAMQKRNGSLL